jgi:hypothetical protein
MDTIEYEIQSAPAIVRPLRPVRVDQEGLPAWVAQSADVLASLGFPVSDPSVAVQRFGERISLSRDGSAPLYLPTAPAGLQAIASARAYYTDVRGDYAEADARVLQASPATAFVAIVHSREEMDLLATDPVDAKHELYDAMRYWIGAGLEVDAHFASH